jgi:hypothetical protein
MESSSLMERGHPVRQRAQHAPAPPPILQMKFALRAQADRMSAPADMLKTSQDVRAWLTSQRHLMRVVRPR